MPTPADASTAGPRTRRATRRGRLPTFKIVLIIIAIFAITGIGVGTGFVMAAMSSLPQLPTLDVQTSMSTTVYDRYGNPVRQLYGDYDRSPVPLSKIPKTLQEAFISVEDRRFYEHHGFDIIGIMRAAINDVLGHPIQGASTITQQLARLSFLQDTRFQRSIKRKVQELILAIELERRYSKDQILELYLNSVEFSHHAAGVQAAAQTYFGKNVWDLDLAEQAMIAGMVNAPSYYDPYTHMDQAKQRQAVVLQAMVEQGYITPQQAAQARAEQLKLAPLQTTLDYPGVWYVDAVRQYLIQKYGADMVYHGGLKVYTALDMNVQTALEQAVHDQLDKDFPIKSGQDYVDMAGVFVKVDTGEVVAMVGGRKYDTEMPFNAAMQAERQPGSAFKPIAVYVPAFEAGLSPGTVVDDVPTTIQLPTGDTYTPKNYDRKFRGLITIREAVALSVNVVAVKTLQMIGVDKGVQSALRFGITTLELNDPKVNDRNNPSFALGGLTHGVTPLELTMAYAALANNGVYSKPLMVLKVEDRYGNVLEENTPQRKQIVDPAVAYLMTNTLESVITEGTGTRENIGRPAAGKTGTTQNNTDAWFMGYTPDYAGGVWMGYRDERHTLGNNVFGGKQPGLVWKAAMLAAENGLPARDWTQPPNVISVPISTKSGLLPSPITPPEFIRNELFIVGTQPTQVDDVFVQRTVCAEHPDFLYEPGCTPCTPVTKVFIQRKVPWTPYTDDKGVTYVPEDASMEAPTMACTLLPGMDNKLPGNPPPGSGQAPGGG